MTNDARIDLERMATEAHNPRSTELDRLDSLELVRLINSEDAGVAEAVAKAEASIARAIDIIHERMARGGRLVYVGAGTSGRLGVLDAAECPPTFNADPGQVVGLIAGGEAALTTAIEGAEDSLEAGRADLEAIDLDENDAVVGIAASGRTPYVIGALDYARKRGAAAIGLTCNDDAEIATHSDPCITLLVGPEILSGSTRMKAGTATKIVLNILSTGAMVRLGKTYGNLMVDVQATNAKLVERSIRIVRAVTGASRAEAQQALDRCGGEVKTAIAAHQLDIDAAEARQRLEAAGGQLRCVLENVK